ncbi:PREDICTED: protein preY, mitochondrial-like [Elephantulus edwardii]|uniref:protein preY, mitochondrial-like n=1 Tax=Elephantulus edwardii TaxID=28737 RepID=UPI0003F0DB1C|nr:PREDICTED: protein preY, mitochondrial-like [Elephantulus edwardii]
MHVGACGRFGLVLRAMLAPLSSVARRCLHASWPQQSGDTSERVEEPLGSLDPTLLEFLVCPLSKKPLRYEASTNELINEELGIACPVIDGIPNMIPQSARMIHQNKKKEEEQLLPITIPVYAFFHFWTWMSIKLFGRK